MKNFFDLQIAIENPYGFVQYKGTSICMDLNCECGHLSHVDGDFVYMVQCPRCRRTYLLPCFIKLILLEEEYLKSAKEELPEIKVAQ